MSESRQRLICRIMFVSLCALPTLGVLWNLYTFSGTQTWEDQVRRELGLDASIETVSTPRPGTVRMRNVSLRDFAGRELTTISEVTVRKNRSGATSVVAAPVQLDLDQFNAVLTQSDAMLRNRPGHAGFQLAFERIEISHADPISKRNRSARLDNCLLQSGMTDKGRFLKVDFDIHQEGVVAESFPSDINRGKCSLTVNTRRLPDNTEVVCQLDTKGTRFPCWMLRGIAPQLAMLGDDCTFSGQFVAWSSGLKIEKSKFENVDLLQLVTASFPHHELHGMATIEMNRCLMNEAGIAAIDATVLCEPINGDLNTVGIGRGLLMAAAGNLQMEIDPNLEAPSLPFGLCHFRIISEGGQLQIKGLCDSAGTLVCDRDRKPLLQCDQQRVLTVDNLVRTLLPESHPAAITNRQCREIIALFPDGTSVR